MRKFLFYSILISFVIGTTYAQQVNQEYPGSVTIAPSDVIQPALFTGGQLEGTLTAVGITATFTHSQNTYANDIAVMVTSGPTFINSFLLQAGGYSVLLVEGEKIKWTEGETNVTPTTFSDLKQLQTPIVFTADSDHHVWIGNGYTGGTGTWESISVTLVGLSEVQQNEEEPVGLSTTPKTSVRIFPNPANDVVNISSNRLIKRVSIINTAGKSVKSLETSGNAVQVNLQDLTAGTYIVKAVTDNNMVTTKQVIKE